MEKLGGNGDGSSFGLRGSSRGRKQPSDALQVGLPGTVTGCAVFM